MASIQVSVRSDMNARVTHLWNMTFGMELRRRALSKYLIATIGEVKSELPDSGITKHDVQVLEMPLSKVRQVFQVRTYDLDTHLKVIQDCDIPKGRGRRLELTHFPNTAWEGELEDLLIRKYEQTIIGKMLRIDR